MELTLAVPSRVRVAVIDVLGREVAMLHEGVLSAGEHRFGLTSEGWSSGVYVVWVAVEGITQARAFVAAR